MTYKPLANYAVHTIGGGWGQEQSDERHTFRVAVIRGTDIPKVAIGDVSTVPKRWETPRKVESRLLRPNDIVIEVSGGSPTSGQHTGRALIVTKEVIAQLGGAVIPASFCRLLRLDDSKVDPRYVTYQIAGLHISGEIGQFENQSTGLANLQFQKFIDNISLGISDIFEQRRVSDVLSCLDVRIRHNRALAAKLEAIARRLFKSWFVDFDPVRAKAAGEKPPGLADDIAALFPDRFVDSELGEIPEGWKVRTIADLAEIVGGSTPSTKNDSYWVDGQHCWATPKDLAGLSSPVLLSTERKVTDAGLDQISSGLLPPGTVLLSSRAPIGYLAIASVPVAINQGFIAMKPKIGVSNLYLLYWAEASHEAIVANANGSTFLEISKKNFRPIPAIDPGHKVMAAFDSVVSPLFDRIVCAEQEIATLTQLRDLLLPRLISGKLRVGETEAMLEEALA